MTTALTTTNSHSAIQPADDWSRDRARLDLLKRTVATGTSDDEFALFVEVARSSGLNPFQRQVYAIMRETYNRETRRKEPRMTIQTGIDGYRLIAARTGLHAGTSDAEYGPEVGGYPEWARVTVKRLMPGGHVAEFPATARWAEYVQMKEEYEGGQRTGRQAPSGQWPKMPYLMLGKVAEALALRKAFPADLSGIYTAEEMSQADTDPAPPTITNVVSKPAPTVATVEPQTAPVNDDTPWDKANRRLRAILGNARKALDLPGPTAAALLTEQLKARYDKASSKDCTPDELHSLADAIDADPRCLIPTTIDAEVVNADEIPTFDTPIPTP